MPGRTERSGAVRRSPVENWSDRAALARFFARLAVKEHLQPDLHVRPLVAEERVNSWPWPRVGGPRPQPE